MTPKRLWLNKIPTQCDVVIEFPGKNLCAFTNVQHMKLNMMNNCNVLLP